VSAPVTSVVQAWIEPRADDPEATSALEVARTRLDTGRALAELRRARLIEITGAPREADRIAALLHASTQFYNPHKERCTLRLEPDDPLPGPPGAELVVVWERGGERRPAAERWWRHETGDTVQVREALVWQLRFEPGADAAAAAHELALLRDARHGLLCNPWSQASRDGVARAGLPWIDPGKE